MKGRKPKLRLVDDDFAPRLPGIVKERGECPAAPRWMSDHSKREWRRSAPILHSNDRLTAPILATFEAYCVAVGAVREAEEALVLKGRYLITEKGSVLHPAFKVQMAAMREIRMLAAELRLTRDAGAAAIPDVPQEDDGWRGLLR